MSSPQQKTLFAVDPGATNWRLYRTVYELEGRRARMVSDPATAPLTSFTERRIPAALVLNRSGNGLECYGEAAVAQSENPTQRDRLRAYFKPAIGAHLLPSFLPLHQLYTHQEALGYTRLMLSALVEGIRQEKWRGGTFSDDVVFGFAHPVHWGTDEGGIVLDEFKAMVRGSFPEGDKPEVRFVSEPEAAIHSLRRSALLPADPSGRVTLILDIGGSTTDLVASELGAEEPVFLARFGGPVGGGLYDAAISDHIAQVLRIPSEALEKDATIGFALRSVAQQMKEGLSRQLLQIRESTIIPQRTVTLVGADGEVYRGTVELDEARFETVTAAVHNRFLDLFSHALEGMGLDESDIGRMVLVGGGSQLFSIVRYLRQRFGAQAVLIADDPGETVVRGVSLEYGADKAERRLSMLFMTGIEPALKAVQAPAERWALVTESGERTVLGSGASTIGRAPSNTIPIFSEKISRWHAEIIVASTGCSLKDQGSTNGTFLDGERLRAQVVAPVNDGTRIRFGDRSYILRRSAVEGNSRVP
jgi:hypothetical protein